MLTLKATRGCNQPSGYGQMGSNESIILNASIGEDEVMASCKSLRGELAISLP